MEQVRLLRAIVGHERKIPAHNRFQYKVFYVDIPVTDRTVPQPRLFSREHFNVFSVYAKDHGSGDDTQWYPWFVERCKEGGITVQETDTIRLITHPRMFGYAFNPISFWLLEDSEKHLRAVLCEVHNTFGDDHNYLLAHEDGRAILREDEFRAEKRLYVSPFNTMRGHYLFSFTNTEGKFEAHIKYFVDDKLTVDTYMGGELEPLTSSSILWSVLSYPFMTLLVVYRIHLQALRLRLKKVPPTLDQRPGRTSGETSKGSTDLGK